MSLFNTEMHNLGTELRVVASMVQIPIKSTNMEYILLDLEYEFLAAINKYGNIMKTYITKDGEG